MWTEELQKMTREHFKKLPMAPMKHFGDMTFGFCILKDGKYVISDMKEGSTRKWIYMTMDEVLAAGWALD